MNEGNASKMSCGNLYSTAIDESSSSFYYSFNSSTNDKTLEAMDNTTLEESSIMGSTIKKQILTGSLSIHTPLPQIIVSEFNTCSSTPNEEKTIRKNLDFQSLGITVLEQSTDNDEENKTENPNNTAAYVESKATAEKIINDMKKIIISSTSISLEIPENKENSEPIENTKTGEKLVRSIPRVKHVNKRASLLVRDGKGNFNNAGSTKTVPNLRRSVLKTNTFTRIISDTASFKINNLMEKNKPAPLLPAETTNPVKEFNFQKRKTLHSVVSKNDKKIDEKQLNKTPEDDIILKNEEPNVMSQNTEESKSNLDQIKMKNSNVLKGKIMNPPVARKLVLLKTTLNSPSSAETKRKKIRRTFNFTDKLTLRRSMLPIRKKSEEDLSEPKKTTTNTENEIKSNNIKQKSIMPPRNLERNRYSVVPNEGCSKMIKTKLQEANKKLLSNSDNSNKCKYCDKQFAFEKALDNHLRLNCTKISCSERRKLYFLTPKANNCGNSATSSKSSITSSTETVSGDSTMKKSGEQMGPPSSSKIKKKIPHSGVYKTPTKSIPCHTCKKNFNTILEYTQHILSHDSTERS